jgi:copper chaperone CopZ
MTARIIRALALVCAPLLAVGVAACASTGSTAGFKGEAHEVAQTISNLQSDATARNEQKVCANDLANTVVTGLGRAKGGCKQAIKNQLAEVDSFELNVKSVQVNAKRTPPTATAQVKSVNAGKTRLGTVSLVKEAGKWKISSFQ